MPPLVISKDVWIEIMSYFTISLADDQPDEVKEKRRLLLSLALTASGLTDIALNELWRSMTTIEPIVQILNYPAPNAGPHALLRFSSDSNSRLEGYWEMKNSFLSAFSRARISRALDYLLRIHHLRFFTFPPPRELLLWQSLSSLERLRTVTPRLQSLSLSTSGGDPQSVYLLLPLLSPSIWSLELRSNSKSVFSNEKSVTKVILAIFSNRNTGLTKVVYRGPASPEIARCILSIPTIQSAIIRISGKNSSSLMHSLPTASNLTKVNIPLGLFAPSSIATVGMSLGELGSLSDVTLCGSARSILICLQAWCKLSHVDTFGLEVVTVTDTPNTRDTLVIGTIISRIGVVAPDLHTLRVKSDTQTSALRLTDILVLQKKAMVALELDNVLVLESTNDLLDIVTSWPTLRLLRIVSPSGSLPLGDARIVLGYYSQHATHLREATLPLDLRNFGVTLITPSPLYGLCPIYHMTIPTSTLNAISNQNPHTVLMIAQNLISLFPRLSTVGAAENNLTSTQLEKFKLQGAIDFSRRFRLSQR